MRRPRTLTVLALLLAWNAVIGTFTALATARSLPLLAFGALTFAVVGGGAAVGLWRARSWAPPALLAAAAGGAVFGITMVAGFSPERWPAGAWQPALLGGVLWTGLLVLAAWRARRWLTQAA